MPTASYTSSSTLVTSADGTHIYTEAVGDPSNICVVFIHCGSTSSFVFDNIFNDPKWTDRFYLVRYDLRGHGRSDKPSDEASWVSQRQAEDFDAVIEHFNVVRPYVAGWSTGATFIADILSQHPPSYLAGIIAVCGVPFLGRFLSRAVRNPELILAVVQPVDVNHLQTGARRFVDMISDSLPHEVRRAYMGEIMMQPRSVLSRYATRTVDATGFLRSGRQAGLPLLVVGGRKDRLINIDEVLKTLDEWIDLEVVIFPEGEHKLWIKHPDEFRDTISTWIAGRRKDP